jgi:lon-related putative ATP-dependent protease
MSVVQPLEPEQLYQACDPTQFNFETTDDIDGEHKVIGQNRAVEAVRFGMGIEQPGYNIYAMGPAGTGKRTMMLRFFNERAVQEPAPYDWCYVHNFETEYKPKAIRLPAGMGMEFRDDMDRLVEQLRTSLASAFESDEYRSRRQVIAQELQEAQEQSLEGLQEKAKEMGIALMRTPAGLILAPLRDGEAISPEEFQNLPEEERKRVEANIESLQAELKEILQNVPKLQREIQERIKELDQEIITFAVGGLVDELQAKYKEFPEIVDHLEKVEKDVMENASSFLVFDSSGEGEQWMAMIAARARAESQAVLQRYKVNLLVDHRGAKGAPVIYEDNPTYQNLIGRVEYSAQMGALVTDFSLIKAGALHQANGGYLLLDAHKLLEQPYAYEALKRSLKSNQIKIESIGQMLSLISTVSLEPEPIPLDVKVALVGDRLIYYTLSEYDPDFNELFKVQADFEDEMDRSSQNQEEYARLIASLVKAQKLKPFDRTAVARVIEHSARLAGDAEKLTTQVGEVANLLREASYWSGESGNGVVTAEDVQRAIDAQKYRAGRLQESVQETILRDIFLIDTSGEVVGQVNGLSVIQLGNHAFGRPSRITARVRLGRGEVVDIEREVDLSGPIHSKGVLILSGFLGARYARERPLSLSASLVFEQSYSGVDGDSASSAELYALLSAIAEVPIKQSFAVTGAINQHGGVQAIGGVNEKIEGFFDICKARGLTGEQGVLIPSSNVKHLMLRWDVIEAVREGKFRIYPIRHIDEGIELLTGIPAGEPDENGQYPPDTINGRVQRRLEELSEKRKELDQATRPVGEREEAQG